MKTLIIYAHPTHLGHHGYFLEELKIVLNNKKIDYEILDLYALNYDPILRAEELNFSPDHKISEITKNYQEKVTAADNLIFIYPTWWQGVPAILKGFIDRTFAAGFAFKYQNKMPKGLLTGKRAAVFSATGAAKIVNKFIVGDKGMKMMLNNVLRFCGFEAKGFSVGSARDLNDRQKKLIISEVSKLVLYLYK
ncbi:MAG: NAD(P)H-dependent oxidoreductase [Candidatus Falkowbacteria bacterium]